MKVLAGDVGGTKTLLMIAQVDGTQVRELCAHRYDSQSWPDLTPLLARFRDDAGAVAAGLAGACIAVAGPVRRDATGERSAITNLPWQLDSRELAASLGLPALKLINDFEAVGIGIEALQETDLAVLQPGERVPHGPRVVLGAGTGLGTELSVWTGTRYDVIASEGGHADFAPADAEQDALLGELRERHGHASWERLVSGPGLATIYGFVCRRDDAAPSQALAQAMRDGDASAAISVAALAGTDPQAVRALDLFISLYGAQAGNLALTCLATGGVYIAGGIAPKLLERLQSGGFITAFLDKGRMRDVLTRLRVQVITHPQVGLLGAALTAARGE
jgi:glucokinase